MPNKTKALMADCFLIGKCVGDAMASRVNIRVTQLSYVYEGKIIVEPVDGYVVDESSAIGLKGTVIDQSGIVMAKLAVASMLNGIVQILTAYSSSLDLSQKSSFAPAVTVYTASGPFDSMAQYIQQTAKDYSTRVAFNNAKRATVIFLDKSCRGWDFNTYQYTSTTDSDDWGNFIGKSLEGK
jgi:hypothetical protein